MGLLALQGQNAATSASAQTQFRQTNRRHRSCKLNECKKFGVGAAVGLVTRRWNVSNPVLKL